MSDDLHRLADGTLAFLPERLNRDPVVLRGLTNDEMWVALGAGAAAGFLIGLPMAIVISIAMLPTTAIICMAVALFGAGSVLRTLKRARPDTWLYRQAEWLAASRLGMGAEVLTHSGAWTVRCTRRRLLQAQP